MSFYTTHGPQATLALYRRAQYLPMRPRIFTDYLKAAQALSVHLDGMGVRHAYVGGFALACLGSDRPVKMNVLIMGTPVHGLRDNVVDLNLPLGDDLQLTFYYTTEENDEHLVREEPIWDSPHVHISTMRASEAGLPLSIKSTFNAGETGLEILHPAILILSAFKRWSTAHTYTLPMVLRKLKSDPSDIHFIIEWLAGRRLRIRFRQYVGMTKLELLAVIRRYHDKYIDDVDHMDKLRSIMPPRDWDVMLSPPETDTPP